MVAPKKNGKSKKNKKKASNEEQHVKTEWDDLDVSTLEDVVSKLCNDHQLSSNQRIQVQTEYEAVQQSYYEATKQNVADLTLKIKVKEMEIEEMMNDQYDDIETYQEKEHFIRYGHDRNMENIEKESQYLMQVEESDHQSMLSQNEKNELALKMEIRERADVNLQEVKNTKARLKKQLDQVYNKLDEQIKKLKRDCNEQEKQRNDDLDLKCHVELREITEQINLHLLEIQRRYGEMFDETKDYYENVSNDNNTRITNQRSELEKTNALISKHENQTKRLDQENKDLSEPLIEYLANVSFQQYGSSESLLLFLFQIASENKFLRVFL